MLDIETGAVAQLTSYRDGEPGRSYVALFPSLDGDGTRLTFHRHGRGEDHSEIVYLDSPLTELDR